MADFGRTWLDKPPNLPLSCPALRGLTGLHAEGIKVTNRYDPQGASRYLWERHGIRRSKQTLAKLRCIGGGPVFRRAGKNVIYDETCLDSWAEAQITVPMASTQASTTEAA